MNLKQHRKLILGVVVCLLGLTLALGAAPPAARAADTVEQAFMSFISFSPLFIAIDKGYFKEQNLDLKMTRFRSSAKMMVPLAQGAIDVASGSPSAGLYNAIAAGQTFRIVADKGKVRKGYGFIPLVVRKDLFDSGRVKSLADIKGLLIGASMKGAISSYSLMRMVATAGFKFSELNTKRMSPPKMYQALKSKSLDLASTVDPWGTRSVLDGDGVILATSDVWLKREVFQIAAMVFSGKFIKEKRGVAQRWINAYVKGIQHLNKHGLASAEIIPIVQKWTKVPKRIIEKAIPPYFANDGSIDKKSLEMAQDFYFSLGIMKKKLSMDEVVDMSFVRNAKVN